MGCCTWDVGEAENPDIRGYLLNNVGRGLLFISQLFLFNAMLSFANDAAGCTTGGTGCEDDDDDDAVAFVNGTAIFSDDDDDDACGRILGLKPVTLVVQVMALGSLVSATFMPVVGSVVDHSPHRRRLGIAGLVVAWLCSLAQTGIAPASWLFLLLLQGSVASAAYLTNVVCAMAYMPELTDDLDGHMQRINAKARVLELATMLVFMSLVATVEGSDSVGVRDTARFAQALSCLVGGPIALASWRYLTPRPTAHAVPEGASLLTAGFLKVRETAAMLAADFPQLYRFLLAFAVMEAGTSSIIGLVVVYVSQQLCLEVGPVLTLAILFTIPGALLSRKLAAGGRAKEALGGTACPSRSSSRRSRRASTTHRTRRSCRSSPRRWASRSASCTRRSATSSPCSSPAASRAGSWASTSSRPSRSAGRRPSSSASSTRRRAPCAWPSSRRPSSTAPRPSSCSGAST